MKRIVEKEKSQLCIFVCIVARVSHARLPRDNLSSEIEFSRARRASPTAPHIHFPRHRMNFAPTEDVTVASGTTTNPAQATTHGNHSCGSSRYLVFVMSVCDNKAGPFLCTLV